MFLCSHLCMKQLSWTGWPKVLDYAILAGAVIEPAPYPEVGLLTSSSSYCSFCFLFSPFVAFRWLRESPPALGFGHFSIAICQFPMHSQRISLQLKFCTFTLTPLPPIPTPFLRLFCSTCLVLPTPSDYCWRHGATEQWGAAACGCGGRQRGVSVAHTDHFHRWILQSQARQAAEESLCGSLQERK